MAPCPTGFEFPWRPTELYRTEGWICGKKDSEVGERSLNPYRSYRSCCHRERDKRMKEQIEIGRKWECSLVETPISHTSAPTSFLNCGPSCCFFRLLGVVLILWGTSDLLRAYSCPSPCPPAAVIASIASSPWLKLSPSFNRKLKEGSKARYSNHHFY